MIYDSKHMTIHEFVEFFVGCDKIRTRGDFTSNFDLLQIIMGRGKKII